MAHHELIEHRKEICYAGCADLTKKIFAKHAYRGFLQEGAEFTCSGVSRQAEQKEQISTGAAKGRAKFRRADSWGKFRTRLKYLTTRPQV